MGYDYEAYINLWQSNKPVGYGCWLKCKLLDQTANEHGGERERDFYSNRRNLQIGCCATWVLGLIAQPGSKHTTIWYGPITTRSQLVTASSSVMIHMFHWVST
jgi:hypothetical protein